MCSLSAPMQSIHHNRKFPLTTVAGTLALALACSTASQRPPPTVQESLDQVLPVLSLSASVLTELHSVVHPFPSIQNREQACNCCLSGTLLLLAYGCAALYHPVTPHDLKCRVL